MHVKIYTPVTFSVGLNENNPSPDPWPYMFRDCGISLKWRVGTLIAGYFTYFQCIFNPLKTFLNLTNIYIYDRTVV